MSRVRKCLIVGKDHQGNKVLELEVLGGENWLGSAGGSLGFLGFLIRSMETARSLNEHRTVAVMRINYA